MSNDVDLRIKFLLGVLDHIVLLLEGETRGLAVFIRRKIGMSRRSSIFLHTFSILGASNGSPAWEVASIKKGNKMTK